jgi:hypothetical protein
MTARAFKTRARRRAVRSKWALRIRHLDGFAHTLCHELSKFQAVRLAKALNDGWLGPGGVAMAVEVRR